jgi:Na+/H+ antiporter NhaC
MFKVVVVPMVENYIVSYNSRILAYDQLNCRFKLLIAVVNTQVIIRLHYYGFTFQLITNLSTSARQEAKNYNAW